MNTKDRYWQLIKNNLFALDKQDLDGLESALAFLMKQLEKHHGKKVMVFIDEYDTPFIEAHVNGFYEEIRGGLSSLLHNALKASTSLQYAMLTGIQRVAKENIFSDLNNLVVCTVKDQEYAQYFGFTEAETKAALEYYGLKLDEEVKAMYDGLSFRQRRDLQSMVHPELCQPRSIGTILGQYEQQQDDPQGDERKRSGIRARI